MPHRDIEKRREKSRRYYREHPDYFKKYYADPAKRLKRNARGRLNAKVVSGVIKRPKICDRCKSKKKIEAHHEDYSKPLEVIWLCHLCHSKEHKKPKL